MNWSWQNRGTSLKQGVCTSAPPRARDQLGLNVPFSHSFAPFCGAVKGIVFFLNGVFLPKIAFPTDTLFTEE